MAPEKIATLVSFYRTLLEALGIPKKQMDPSRTLGSLTSDERLAHAHYLLNGIVVYSQNPNQQGKTGRHLASVQMILSFENMYTLQDLMDHNRPG